MPSSGQLSGGQGSWEAALRAAGGVPGTVYGHRIDPVSVTLPRREFERAFHKVGRTQLLDHVWEGGYERDSKVVDVYIGYLRRKVDAPFNRACIQTVRGVGYRYDG